MSFEEFMKAYYHITSTQSKMMYEEEIYFSIAYNEVEQWGTNLTEFLKILNILLKFCKTFIIKIILNNIEVDFLKGCD